MAWGAIIGAVASGLIQDRMNDRANRQNSTSSSSSTSNSEQSGTLSQDRNTLNLSGADQNLFRALAGLSTSIAPEYTRQNAIADTQGLMAGAARTIREQTLPGIMAADQQNGAYGGSMQQFLYNDAVARESEGVARQQLQAIADYGNIMNALLGTSGNNLRPLVGANVIEVSDTATTERGTETSSGTDSGTGAGGNRTSLTGQALGGAINSIFNRPATPQTDAVDYTQPNNTGRRRTNGYS